MGGGIPAKAREITRHQAGMITRKQATGAGMSPGNVDTELKSGRWRPAYRGVYETFFGPMSCQGQLWAAVLYAGERAVLSHETAGEVQWLVDRPAAAIHVTVPADRRVTRAPGLVIHLSDLLDLPDEYPMGELPTTRIADTITDMAESCREADDVYGLVTRAFGRKEVDVGEFELLLALKARPRLRWRTELTEAAVAGASGAHSVLELRWDRDVAEAHGLPMARKQVRFEKEDGTSGFRDREYPEWGIIIELDGRESHPGERREADRARDRQAARSGRQTLRFGWRATRYEACESAVRVTRELWKRGWRGRPRPCSPDCQVATLLGWLDRELAANPALRDEWARRQAVHEAAQQKEAAALAARHEVVRQSVEYAAQVAREVRARRKAARQARGGGRR